MSDKDNSFLRWKIKNGMYGWDHEYADLIDKAYDQGVDSGIAEIDGLQAANRDLQHWFDDARATAERLEADNEALRRQLAMRPKCIGAGNGCTCSRCLEFERQSEGGE